MRLSRHVLAEDFYGKPDSAYMSTTIPMFRKAGIEIGSVQDILNNGIYITNAVKTPKSEYAVSKESIEDSLPYLEKELALFPNVKVIMLMGMWQKKAFNMICKKATKKKMPFQVYLLTSYVILRFSIMEYALCPLTL